MIADLLFAWLFAAVYVLICVGCFIGGIRMIVKDHNLTATTVGLLISMLGILGLLILF